MEPDVRILIIDNQASVVKDLRALIVCVQPAVWRRLLCATSRPDTCEDIYPYYTLQGNHRLNLATQVSLV